MDAGVQFEYESIISNLLSLISSCHLTIALKISDVLVMRQAHDIVLDSFKAWFCITHAYEFVLVCAIT